MALEPVETRLISTIGASIWRFEREEGMMYKLIKNDYYHAKVKK